MSLQQIIQNKDKRFQTMLANFESEFETFSKGAQKVLTRLFSRGIFDKDIIEDALRTAGYTDLVNAWLDNYSEVIRFNKQIANEIGVSFILTTEAVKKFDIIQNIQFDKFEVAMQKYATDMRAFGYEYVVQGKSFKDIAFKNGVNDLLKTMGRSASAEAYTGIGIADSAIKLDWYEQAGIDKYVYMGPNDGKTRDECQATLNDPHQDTGWTTEEVNSSKTLFLERGGYGCRHEWVPFTGE